MSSGFAPSADQDRASGVQVSSQPYPPGVAGLRLSLLEIAKRVRAGATSPRVQAVAGDALLKASFSGRGAGAGTVFDRAGALLNFVRSWMLYAPDPPNTEMTKGAETMLCVADKLCVRVGDCDDQVVLLGSMLLSIGIPTQVVLQHFAGAEQDHVIVEVTDDDGVTYKLDPSYDFPAGSAAQATSETRIDPMSAEQVGLLGEVDGTFIGVGRAPRRARSPNHFMMRRAGMGAVPTPIGWIYTPSDVMVYRSTWDGFVKGVAAAEKVAGEAWAAAAAGQTPSTPINTAQFSPPPNAKLMQAIADMHAGRGDNDGTILQFWNAYAGLTNAEIVYLAHDILLSEQRAVESIISVNIPQLQLDCPELALPSLPSLDVQATAIAHIEGLSILASGILQMFTMGAKGVVVKVAEVGQEVVDRAKELSSPSTIVPIATSAAVIAASAAAIFLMVETWPARKMARR